MNLFGSIQISGSGLDAAQTWINTSAGNVANMNDVSSLSEPAYQQETPIFEPITTPTGEGEGVAVTSVDLGSANGIVAYDPSSPLANSQGMVREADVSTGQQMVDLISAQNDYQANVAALQRAQTAYQSALTLGT